MPGKPSRILIVLLVFLSAHACGGDTGGATRLETRAAIEGKIVLVDQEGMSDPTRLSVDIGRGEGGAPVDTEGNFHFGDLESDVYTLTVTYSGGLKAKSAFRRAGIIGLSAELSMEIG